MIEARNISKCYDGKLILRDFSLRVHRGERVALVGPNGAGKTTLLKMLTGQLQPDSGTVVLGSNVQMVEFDQNRSALDPDLSLWETLTGDAGMRVSGRADQVMVHGTPRHVVGYLKEFLFDERQARAPVRSLSGGEKARLLLARIMARDSNLLVLDEPTNDLDVETLDLLQDILGDYGGTVLLVSHDRDFLDRVATTTIAMERGGKATVYAGGWTDYQAQKGYDETVEKRDKPTANKTTLKKEKRAGARGLSFTQQHRLKALPDQIARLEAEIAKLSDYLSASDLFTAEPLKFRKATEALADRQVALRAAEDEWLALEEKADNSPAG